MTEQSQPNGVSCIDCGLVSQITFGPNDAPTEDFDRCPDCDSNETEAVIITDCPNGGGRTSQGASAPDCDDEWHDWGLGKHVAELAR